MLKTCIIVANKSSILFHVLLSTPSLTNYTVSFSYSGGLVKIIDDLVKSLDTNNTLDIHVLAHQL